MEDDVGFVEAAGELEMSWQQRGQGGDDQLGSMLTAALDSMILSVYKSPPPFATHRHEFGSVDRQAQCEQLFRWFRLWRYCELDVGHEESSLVA